MTLQKPLRTSPYLDATNLYGWAMRQYLPRGNFFRYVLEVHSLEIPLLVMHTVLAHPPFLPCGEQSIYASSDHWYLHGQLIQSALSAVSGQPEQVLCTPLPGLLQTRLGEPLQRRHVRTVSGKHGLVATLRLDVLAQFLSSPKAKPK